MVVKCYPWIRGCAYVKIFEGISLMAVGVYMLAMTPIILDCGETRSQCPNKFGELIDNIEQQPLGHLNKEATINSYCDCLVSCINYMSVYRTNGQSNDANNCFRLSQEAGVASSVVAGKVHPDTYTVLPGLSETECVTCATTSTEQDELFFGLVILSTFCGVALFVSAGCEHLEVKRHNVSFMVFGILSDVVCACALSTALLLSEHGASFADLACAPEVFQDVYTKAGEDSTLNSPDEAALFTQFFLGFFSTAMDNICGEHATLHVYSLVCALGIVSSGWSFCATLFAMCGWSDDGDSDDDSDDMDNFRHNEMKEILSAPFGSHRYNFGYADQYGDQRR